MSALPPKAGIRGFGGSLAKGGDGIMKAFVFACIAAVVIAIIGAIVLGVHAKVKPGGSRIFKFGRCALAT